eukprot:CAMPEP_0119568068 /NCGR_PEP_ID=MMETSP1352-20130426/37812_1 /TAXON_ID=265584 /ORGANISM="Stauroneis constricta, Strain CCMP1120" /LENGTH=69 /DNA_ID=CAMNT_0007617405 /DNA_START=84 /DNA_END=290 /DNA_ORIENTATION=-
MPWIGQVELGLFRMFIFRLSVVLLTASQLVITFQHVIHVWFEAAHSAARDDRYLIGEILMNYVPETQAT